MKSDELPRGWTWTTLGEIATTIRNGISTKPDGDTGLPILRISAVRPNRLDLRDVRYLREDSPRLDAFAVGAGDLLFTRYNGSPDFVGVAAVVPRLDYRLVHPDKLIKVQIPAGTAAPDFVAYAVNIGASRAFLASRIRTTAGQAGISGADLKALPVPLAPRRLQDQIVLAIDQHLSDIDAGVAGVERALANLKRYRASVLKAACEGRLVPTEAELARKEKRDYEPADVLLRRILKERRARWEADQLAKMKAKDQPPKDDKWKANYEEPEPPDPGVLGDLPKGWTWVNVATLAKAEVASITDGPFGSNLKTEHYVDEGPRVVRLQNIGDGRFMNEKAHISEDHFEKLKKHAVVEGDLLIAALGEELPRSCMVPEWLGPAIVKADCIRVRCDERLVSPPFAMNALNALPIRQRVAKRVHGVGRPRLNLTEIRAIEVPLPPLAEQHRIVAEVDRLLSTADETEQTLRAQLARAARLRQAVLKHAFEGKLVPQDPNDEPATALLARLRANPPAAPKRGPRTKKP